MKNSEYQNFALASPRDPSYIFFLKSPELTANNEIYFDEAVAFVSMGEPQLQATVYYDLKYIVTDRRRRIIKITAAVPLAIIGQEWDSQYFLRNMQNFQGTLKQPSPDSKFLKEVARCGELKVNDEGWIYVKASESGFRKKLKLVNNPFAIPLLKGCKVDYFLRKYA